MDANDRPRKKLTKAGIGATRRASPVSRGVGSGTLKGRPQTPDERIAPAKPSRAAAARMAADAEQEPGRRKELPLPAERGGPDGPHDARSLRLTLRVEGERISVINAIEVDAPPSALEPVRGATFLEVRAADRVVALERLVDPGVAVGIPDPSDTKEFRGHREMALPSYEVAIRVPLEALELTALPSEGPRNDRQPPIEATIYRADEVTELDPIRFEADRTLRRRLTRVAESGPLGIDDVRRASRADNRKPEPRQQS